jgi:MinD superfamily P-loop ATPase
LFHIAIASGKGGTGKTTVAVNLAFLLGSTKKTALVDLDVEEPNAQLFLQGDITGEYRQYRQVPSLIEEACTSCGLCQDVCNFHAIIQLGDKPMIFPQLCHSCHACTTLCPQQALVMKSEPMGMITAFGRDGLQSLEGRLDVGQEQAVPLIHKTKKLADKSFSDKEFLLFDSPPGTSCPFVAAVDDADYVLLVTEPTPFGLNDLKLAVETVRGMGLRFSVVINRAGIGDERVQQWCEQESIDVIANIPDSREAAVFYSRGELICESDPRIRNEFLQMIDRLQDRVTEALS